MKVWIVDNGKRCFVLPCYSWDLVAVESGSKLASVARIVNSDGQPILDPDGVVSTGIIEDYLVDEGPNAGILARQFRLHRNHKPKDAEQTHDRP